MKIISITYDDYANYMWNVTKALRTVGLDAECYKIIPSPSKYKEEATIMTNSKMRILVCDVLQLMHTREQLLSYLPKHKRLFVYHTGTRYRQKQDVYNAMFNKRVERTFVDIPDLFNIKAKNCTLFPSPMNITDKINYRPEGRKLIVGHFHPKPFVKGSHLICNAMSQIQDVEFRYSSDLIPNDENLKRMAECDIIIDLMNNFQNGVPYGAWGVTTLEAAAMGKIVLSSDMFEDVYERFFDVCPVGKIDNEKGLIDFIKFYNDMDINEFRMCQNVFHEWVKSKHSYEASGKYFKQFI